MHALCRTRMDSIVRCGHFEGNWKRRRQKKNSERIIVVRKEKERET